jgi:hypothetical protein
MRAHVFLLAVRLAIIAGSVALGFHWRSAVFAAAVGGLAWGVVSGACEGLTGRSSTADRVLEALALLVGFEMSRELRKNRRERR